MVRSFVLTALAYLLVGTHCAFGAGPDKNSDFEALFAELNAAFASSPERVDSTLEKLKALEPTLTPQQNVRYLRAQASALGLKGRHEERIALAQSLLNQPTTPMQRASILYELIDGSTALGRYENALQAMNESILLLPDIEKPGAKIVVLQGAIALMHSFHAFDDALDMAERIYSLRVGPGGSYAACLGLTDKVELYFVRGSRQLARSLVPEAILACEAYGNKLFTLITKTNAAIALIDSEEYAAGINTSLPLLREFALVSKNSDYIPQLEEAMARAYLKTGNPQRAEVFGLRAYQRAQLGNVLLLKEKTSETMASIKTAQGQLASAIEYYKINLALKKKVLDDQLQRNLAYQRAKFEAQDKANQLALLEQKNKNLGIKAELQQGKYQNLVLLMTLGLVVLAILGAWLARALRQKNAFRLSAQVDGLTQVSNRAHFTACARHIFADSKIRVSLVLFDMDFFKKINDTYGHATGDWVLKTVCERVGSLLRKEDCVGRLGGEEFALCLTTSTEEEVKAMAERCRDAIAAIDTQASGFDFKLSASFGVATRPSGQTSSFEETLVEADKALYLSKNQGRNRVTVFSPSAEEAAST